MIEAMNAILAIGAFVWAVIAQAAPAPTPTPTPTPAPPVTWGGDFLISSFHTNGVNATGTLDTPIGVDKPDRTDFSALMVNVAATSGKFKATASAGEYNLISAGFAINPSTQRGANTELFGALPFVALQYAFSNQWSVAAGKFAALLGQESPMTWQNVNVQRGLAWSMEPTISRGVHVAYSQGPWSATLEYNDAYYSGNKRAAEGIVGYAPTSGSNFQFAWIVPSADAPANPTVTVGNKTEYDFMYAGQVGKLQLLPYLLWVHSPSSTALGYPRSESAFAGVLMGTYAFNSDFSVAARFESASNSSGMTDTSPNADLVGYGPGSGADSITITPTYHRGWAFARLEYSHVGVRNAAPGLAFGTTGNLRSQDRFGVEFGGMH